jgi:AcrR family transcriptional regulator
LTTRVADDGSACIAGARRTRFAPAARRAQILAAAARTILTQGISSVSLERIARDLGISKGLIYIYFGNRDTLLAALLHQEQAELRDRGLRAALNAKSFDILIRKTTRIYLEHARDRGALIQSLLSDPSVTALMREENRADQDRTHRFFVRATRRQYGLPLATAVAVVQLLMAVTGEAGKLVADGQLEIEGAEVLCFQIITGGLAKLGRQRKPGA